MRRDKPIFIAVSTPNGRITCITQTSGVLSYNIQHRLNVRRRAGDHAQNFTRRRLLFQRLLQFVEQPHVFDGDDSLASESLQELDLLVRERAYFGAANQDSPDGASLAHQRSGQYRAMPSTSL